MFGSSIIFSKRILVFMGSFIELNDTLQITAEQGFPARVFNLKKHLRKPVTLTDVEGKVFEFHGKESARVFPVPPTRCFLVENIDGKWLYWGKILVLEQTIHFNEGKITTSGKFKVIQVYEPKYQEQITRNESPAGKSLF